VRAEQADGAHFGCDFIWLEPWCGFPMHTHAGDHILYVIEGEGFVHIDGEDIAVSAGHVIHIAAEYPHRLFTHQSHLTIAASGHPHTQVHSHERMTLLGA
jgi:quercetin dioxygenase-like cupin family protein